MTELLILIGNNTTGSGVDAVKACVRMGFHPVILTTDPGRHDVDRDAGATIVAMNEWSFPAAIEKCRTLAALPATRIIGVTTFSDPRVALAAEIAEVLGLRHLNPAAAAACLDKVTQRRTLDAADVASPFWRAYGGESDSMSDLRYPVVLKPARGSGSVGVRLANNPTEAGEMASRLINGDLTGREEREIIIEEYIDGPQFSAELFDGHVIGVTANHIGVPPSFIATGHDFPASLDAQSLAVISNLAARAVKALRVGQGPSHVEIRMGVSGPRVIEVNPRLAGGLIPQLVQAATGIDLIACTLGAAVGKNVAQKISSGCAGALRNILAPRRGRFGGLAQIGMDDVVVRELRRRGEVVGGFGDFRDRVACVIAIAENLCDATSMVERARAACATCVIIDVD